MAVAGAVAGGGGAGGGAAEEMDAEAAVVAAAMSPSPIPTPGQTQSHVVRTPSPGMAAMMSEFTARADAPEHGPEPPDSVPAQTLAWLGSGRGGSSSTSQMAQMAQLGGGRRGAMLLRGEPLNLRAMASTAGRGAHARGADADMSSVPYNRGAVAERDVVRIRDAFGAGGAAPASSVVVDASASASSSTTAPSALADASASWAWVRAAVTVAPTA